MFEAAAWLIELGQQVWQQSEQREETGSVCFVAVAPFLVGAAVVGLHSFARGLRRRWSTPGPGGEA